MKSCTKKAAYLCRSFISLTQQCKSSHWEFSSLRGFKKSKIKRHIWFGERADCLSDSVSSEVRRGGGAKKRQKTYISIDMRQSHGGTFDIWSSVSSPLFDSDKVSDGAPDAGAPENYAFLQPRIQLWESDKWPHICKRWNKKVCNGADAAAVTGCRRKGKTAGPELLLPADAADLVSADYFRPLWFILSSCGRKRIPYWGPVLRRRKEKRTAFGAAVFTHKRPLIHHLTRSIQGETRLARGYLTIWSDGVRGNIGNIKRLTLSAHHPSFIQSIWGLKME